MNTTPVRETFKCNECGRVVRGWGRLGHWQTHNPPTDARPHFKPAPRGEVDALFKAVQ